MSEDRRQLRDCKISLSAVLDYTVWRAPTKKSNYYKCFEHLYLHSRNRYLRRYQHYSFRKITTNKWAGTFCRPVPVKE